MFDVWSREALEAERKAAEEEAEAKRKADQQARDEVCHCYLRDTLADNDHVAICMYVVDTVGRIGHVVHNVACKHHAATNLTLGASTNMLHACGVLRIPT